ncbi:kinase-like domain-containing protein [Mycena amicta]|nr:kinase-like domain-containing protein [Mycena amicta]
MNPSDSLPDLTGELVDNGTLEILSRVGCGAYGHVYKARDTTSPSDEPRFYAVKCMRRHEHKSRADRLQRNELRVHKMASHSPHIVTFHRAFVSEEMTFVVLDYVPGDFFSALVDREIFRCKPTLIKKVFHEILDAVEFLHRNSIYPSRPQTRESSLRRIGPAHSARRLWALDSRPDFSNEFGCGSRFYMSPESLDRTNPGGCYSARSSDIWALSIIFTNLISGRHPWSCAVMTDQGYAKFRSNNNYLYRALRLTREANALA